VLASLLSKGCRLLLMFWINKIIVVSVLLSTKPITEFGQSIECKFRWSLLGGFAQLVF